MYRKIRLSASRLEVLGASWKRAQRQTLNMILGLLDVSCSENRPSMLKKENYVPWSSRLLWHDKSRPNGKLIYNSIINGPYVRRMIPEPGDANRAVLVNETFHEQTDDELTDKELKQVEANDQEIQTILLGLPEDIYVAVDSCETAQEIWFTYTDGESIESYYHCFLKLMNDFKRNKHFPEKIASNLKFLNNLQPEWSRHVTIVHQTKDLHTADYTQLYDFLKYNQKEVDDQRAERLAKTYDPLALMANSINPFNYPVFHQDIPSPSTYMQQPQPNNNNYNPQPSFNQNYMQQPMPNPKDIIDPITAINMELVLMTKAFKLNYSTPTNNNQRISLNPRNRQIAQPGMNMGQDKQMQMVRGNSGNHIRQYAGQNVRNKNGYNAVQNVGNQVVYNAVQNLSVQNVGNQNGLIVVPGIANQNPNGNGNVVAARAEGNAIGNNVDLDEIEEVNANCILMANLQQASTLGTQTDKAPVYDSDGSAENDSNVISEVSSVEQSGGTVYQHPATVEETRAYFESLYNNLAIEVEKANSVNRRMKETNAGLTTELARYKNQEKCFEISQEKYDKLERCYQKSVYQEQCLTKRINALHLSSGKQIMTLNEEISNLNKQHSKEKSIVSSLLEEKKKLKSDFKIREDKLFDKQIQLENKIKELDNILVKTEETLQLAQESRLKMKQLNKEIKPANYTKINHLSGVFVSQTAKSREEVYFSNTSKMANVSKSFSIPNEEFSDDTTPSVARKFLNEVKSTIVTLQRVVKQKMTLDIHNWSSSVHQEVHKIVKDEIFPIINQVDARLQNFEIQFLKEAAEFVRDFKSLAKEADESLAKHKALELEIERLLRAVVSQDIMSIVQNPSVVDSSNLQTELDRTKERFENCIIKKENEYAKLWNDWYKKYEECKYDKILYDKAYNDMQQKIERLQAQLGDQKGKSKDTPCVSNTLDPLSQKLENENVELEFQVRNYEKENAHLKTTYKNLFDSISVTHAQTKIIIDSFQNKLHDTMYESAKLRAQLFDKVSEQKGTSKGMSVNTQFCKQSILGKPPSSSKPKLYVVTPFPKSKGFPKIDKIHALSKPFTSNSIPTPQESKVVNNDKVITPGMFRINHFKPSREDKYVPTKVRASVRTNPIIVSQPHVITKKDVISDSNGLSST
ncbi:hypothetical protein Tco_0587605 [Tanacetum coccineum]